VHTRLDEIVAEPRQNRRIDLAGCIDRRHHIGEDPVKVHCANFYAILDGSQQPGDDLK
jgi:hypothetical protein